MKCCRLSRGLLLASVVASVSVASCGGPKGSERAIPEGSVLVGLVAKNDLTPYFARIPREKDRLILTSPRVGAALSQTFSLQVPEGRDLWTVEMVSESSPRLWEEVTRWGRVALVMPPSGISPVEDEYLLPQVVSADRVEPTLTAPGMTPSPFNLTEEGEVTASDIPDLADEARLKAWLAELTGDRETTIDQKVVRITDRRSTTNKELARRWIEREFGELGYQMSRHRYEGGQSVVAELAGTSGKTLLLTAHFDTVMTSGADDNGSGVVSALAIARALSSRGLSDTLRVVLFDGEEQGLRGSRAYVRDLVASGGDRAVKGVFNIEMTGWDEDGDFRFHAIHCDENSSKSLADRVVQAGELLSDKMEVVDACTSGSDHAPFWEKDIPAVVVSQNFFGGDGNSCYHRSCDKIGLINFRYMRAMTGAIAGAVVSMGQ